MNNLEKFSTAQLVEELKKRESVKTTVVEPYGRIYFDVEGSAVVLVVID